MATLDANDKDAATTAVTITTEKCITMYVKPVSGGTDKYKICLQISPDGTDWYDVPSSVITGKGYATENCVAGKARAIVAEAEGKAASVDITILVS